MDQVNILPLNTFMKEDVYLAPVLKLKVNSKSGQLKYIENPNLYQSCGMSLFSLYMFETDMYQT